MSTTTQHLVIVASRATPQNAGSSSDPIEWIEAEHYHQLSLCDLLERLADSLPHDLEGDLALTAADLLRRSFRAHHAFEDAVLFPMLRRRTNGDSDLRAVLKQLQDEHDCDETFAEEIAEELERAASISPPTNPDMLGYMLRGFFVSKRRHIEWETVTVIPAARRLLTSADLAELQRSIVGNDFDEAAKNRVHLVLASTAEDPPEVCENCGKRNGCGIHHQHESGKLSPGN